MSHVYAVVFENGLEKLHLFADKERAKDFKAEHKHGKFAAVIKMKVR